MGPAAASAKNLPGARVAQRVILIGGGGHARVVGEAVLANAGHFELLGFVDPAPSSETEKTLNVPHLGDDSALERYMDAALVLGIGALGPGDVRRSVVARLGADRRWATITHPETYLSPSASLGEGVVVLPRALLHAGVHVGAHSLVNSGAVVEHDVVLGEHVLVGPGAVLGGGVIVGDAVFIGLGAIIRNSVRIGAGAVVGMGAVVVRDVAAGSVVMGNPARAKGAGGA